MMANSTESWSLCDGAPPLQGHPILNLGSEKQYNSEMDYDRQVMEKIVVLPTKVYWTTSMMLESLKQNCK